MRNIKKTKLKTFCFAFLQLLFIGYLWGQPTVNISFTNNQAIVKTTVSPLNGEASVGLFYRMEHSSGTYFWSDTVFNTNTSHVITKSFSDLPAGQYDIVCYETRKGGPIRTGHGIAINSGSGSINCRNCSLPFQGASLLMTLTPSWNVFSDPLSANISDPQYTSNTNPAGTPNTPWLFVTLTVNNWDQAGSYVKVQYDATNLAYEGTIVNNYYGQKINAADGKWISDIDDSQAGILTIKPSSQLTGNGQKHIFLAFKKRGTGLDNLINLSFSADYYYRSDVPIHSTLITLPVKGKPHDPNSLMVDKNTLCPCSSNEQMTYTVNFQNQGNAAATEVKVKLLQSQFLIVDSVKIIDPLSNVAGLTGKTYLKNAVISYDKATQTFKITPIVLPGSKQQKAKNTYYSYWETEDYFKFIINKSDCLSVGTVIEPQAEIIFSDGVHEQAPILTNLEKTVLVNGVIIDGVKCPQTSSCKNCKIVPGPTRDKPRQRN